MLKTIAETEAREVYVLHRGSGALVRHLRQLPAIENAHPVTKLLRAPELPSPSSKKADKSSERQKQLTLF